MKKIKEMWKMFEHYSLRIGFFVIAIAAVVAVLHPAIDQTVAFILITVAMLTHNTIRLDDIQTDLEFTTNMLLGNVVVNIIKDEKEKEALAEVKDE